MDVRVSTSQPFVATPSQFAKPVEHTSEQRLAAHAAVALAPPGHVVPHAPQLAALVVVSTHSPPHRMVGGMHVIEQTPIEQLCPEGQALPHVPQWVLLV